jgi:hypothetical protein
VIEILAQNGDAANNWVNSYRYTYTYDVSGNQTGYLSETWDGTNWANSYRGTYTYNVSGWETEYLGEEWDTGSGWVNDYFETYEYDLMGNNTSWTSQDWDGTQWVNHQRGFTTWLLIISDVTSDGNLVTEYSLENNYPNPFNPYTTIKFSIPEAAFVNIKVYNLIGQEIAELVNEQMHTGNHEVTFDAASLPSGIYFYKIQANNFVETKKMMLMK